MSWTFRGRNWKERLKLRSVSAINWTIATDGFKNLSKNCAKKQSVVEHLNKEVDRLQSRPAAYLRHGSLATAPAAATTTASTTRPSGNGVSTSFPTDTSSSATAGNSFGFAPKSATRFSYGYGTPGAELPRRDNVGGIGVLGVGGACTDSAEAGSGPSRPSAPGSGQSSDSGNTASAYFGSSGISRPQQSIAVGGT
eukprot:Rmarinus@m.5015